MDELTYSKIISKTRRPTSPVMNDPFVLDKMLMADLDSKDRNFAEKVRHAFVNELKIILKSSKFSEIVDKLFQLQSQLEELSKKIDGEDDLPGLSIFYNHLAPLLMRALADYFREKKNTLEEFENSALESIRVAIEEEVYLLSRKNNDVAITSS